MDFTFLWVYLKSLFFNEIYLILFFSLDILFILSNLKRLKLTIFEFSVIGILFFHLILGILILPQYNDAYTEVRALKDTVLPIMFLMKCIIFRKIFSVEKLANYKKFLIRGTFFIIAIQFLMLLLALSEDGYRGLNPPVNILLASFLSGGPFLFFILSIATLIFAGKRSVLVSLAIAWLFVSRRVTKSTFLACLIAGIVYSLTFLIDISNIPIVDKFVYTFDAVKKIMETGLTTEQKRAAMYAATAGRSEEIFTILAFMEPINWLTGKGPGYSYEFTRLLADTVDGKGSSEISNAHFTPLAITYKFGIIIALYFIFYTSRNIIWGIKNGEVLISSMLLLFIIQSIFSFNIFSEILYPIFVSWLMVVRKDKKISIQN